MNKIDNRNYGIDLLRMVSMAMVLMLHVLGAGGVLGGSEHLSANYNVAWLLETAAYCAVNCYALISGFVGYRSKIKYSNVALLWIQVAVTSVLGYLIFWTITGAEFDGITLLRAFFPVINNYGWYFTCYFALFFFMPLLNHVICTMEEKDLKILCGSVVGLFTVIGTMATRDVFQLQDGYSVIWLGALYLLGGCIARFGWFTKIAKWKLLLVYAGSCLFAWGVKLLIELWNNPWLGQFTYSEVMIRYKSPAILAAAVALLLIFRGITLPKWIKTAVKILSPAAFGVYITHMHPEIWNRVIVGKFGSLGADNPLLMILEVLGAVLILYLGFSVIDLVRGWIFKLLKVKERLTALEIKLRNRKAEKAE